MRNVLVTGASRGLGLAIAGQLVADGFHVIAVARTRSDALERLMADSHGALHFRPCDLAEIDALARFVRQIRADVGPLWGLVNNAGIGTSGLLANMSQAQIEALIRLNTLSPIMLTKFVARGMMAEGGGRIVNMSSIVAGTGFNGLAVYSATKASLIGFTKALARELGRVGVTVNAVSPGFIDTELTGGMAPADRDRVVGRSALRRLAEAEDVAGAVSYLLSERARNVTGTVMTVDAGATA
jgi:3-oxoacyl-[acyl-carrier protein] reductase